MSTNREAIAFCLCGPVASGKTSISREVVKRVPGLRLSISTTTRLPRDSETDGVQYFFVKPEEFERRVAAGMFIEHATVSGYHYGTEKVNRELATKAGEDLLLDIDYQGAAELNRLYRGSVVTIAVVPPSFAELRNRLTGRGDKDPTYIESRLQLAKRELAILLDPDFSDFLVVNDQFETSIDEVVTIVRSERLRLSRSDHGVLATKLIESDS